MHARLPFISEDVWYKRLPKFSDSWQTKTKKKLLIETEHDRKLDIIIYNNTAYKNKYIYYSSLSLWIIDHVKQSMRGIENEETSQKSFFTKNVHFRDKLKMIFVIREVIDTHVLENLRWFGNRLIF